MLQSSTRIQLEKHLFPSLLELKSPLLARPLLQVILPRHHLLLQVSLPLAHLLLQVALRLARLLLLPINQLGRPLGLLHPPKAHLLGHQVRRVRQKNQTCEVEICLMIRL